MRAEDPQETCWMRMGPAQLGMLLEPEPLIQGGAGCPAPEGDPAQAHAASSPERGLPSCAQESQGGQHYLHPWLFCRQGLACIEAQKHM